MIGSAAPLRYKPDFTVITVAFWRGPRNVDLFGFSILFLIAFRTFGATVAPGAAFWDFP